MDRTLQQPAFIVFVAAICWKAWTAKPVHCGVVLLTSCPPLVASPVRAEQTSGLQGGFLTEQPPLCSGDFHFSLKRLDLCCKRRPKNDGTACRPTQDCKNCDLSTWIASDLLLNSKGDSLKKCANILIFTTAVLWCRNRGCHLSTGARARTRTGSGHFALWLIGLQWGRCLLREEMQTALITVERMEGAAMEAACED